MSLKIGDKVRVVNDWADVKKESAIINRFQKNGTMTFAYVKWLGKKATLLADEWGVLFPLDELRKV